jgi:hypothetical protein
VLRKKKKKKKKEEIDIFLAVISLTLLFSLGTVVGISEFIK